ncbi:MAG: hypothetical protein ACRCY3_08990 [Sphingorhabdus sp.]
MALSRDPWWIIGSAAIAIHLQQDVGVKDIDILLSVDDACRVRHQLAIPYMPARPHPLFASKEYFAWYQPAIPVEFMAGFSVCVQHQWHPIECRTRQSFVVGDERVYVPDIGELASLLKLFGRPKDLNRLALLKA